MPVSSSLPVFLGTGWRDAGPLAEPLGLPGPGRVGLVTWAGCPGRAGCLEARGGPARVAGAGRGRAVFSRGGTGRRRAGEQQLGGRGHDQADPPVGLLGVRPSRGCSTVTRSTVPRRDGQVAVPADEVAAVTVVDQGMHLVPGIDADGSIPLGACQDNGLIRLGIGLTGVACAGDRHAVLARAAFLAGQVTGSA